MLVSFLLIVGQNSRYCVIRKTFGRSQYTISCSFNKVLKALNTIAIDMMAKPGSTVPERIRESTRFYLYFKVSDDIIVVVVVVFGDDIIIVFIIYYYYRIASKLLMAPMFQQ